MPIHATFAPLLTERDDAESAEGGIDPLGLYIIADSLGVKLIPGIRERQSHPRFITAMAVSLAVCRDFAEDTVAKDGSSEPWLVFEWYLVEGLVRTSQSGQTVGLPGSLKVIQAVRDRVPVSAKRYLKSPSIFGFHGIYRLLARTLGIEAYGQLDDAGHKLLEIWAREQGLAGFVGVSPGRGQAVRKQWVDAVLAGLDKGATDRSNSWNGWTCFGKHLSIYDAGSKERQYLASLLHSDAAGFRQEMIEFLVSSEGRSLWHDHRCERRMHEAAYRGAADGLRTLLDAISKFEQFCRLCQDAFDDSLCEMTRQRGKVSPGQLGRLQSVQRASRTVPNIFGKVQARLEPFGEGQRFQQLFESLAEKCSPVEWVERLLEHHRKTQRLKPPDGKNPWFERFDDGSYIIRPLYLRDKGGRNDDSYVHAYRTRALWSFARDLKLVGK